MLRSDHFNEKPEANLEIEPNAKKSRSDSRTPNIATMDNGTLVEAFKFLNYVELSKSSFVSKRYWNLICTHRHSLARLYVARITMRRSIEVSPAFIQIFDKRLFAEEYNEWVIHNQYSRQIQFFESQVTGCSWHSTQNDRKFYHLLAYDDHKADGISNLYSTDPNHALVAGGMIVFKAQAELNHENWALFQHFVRLITDPFVYIRHIELISENDVMNLLTGEINPDRNRLQCKRLIYILDSSSQKPVSWITDHVLCREFQIYYDFFNPFYGGLPEAVLIDFFLTGALFTSKIKVEYSSKVMEPSRLIIGFVQKFGGLKKCDEYQVVESIKCEVAKRSVEKLKRKCAKYIVKEEGDRRTFEFVNNDIGKKLQITHKISDNTAYPFLKYYFSLKITNL